jgi:hypothetical protein
VPELRLDPGEEVRYFTRTAERTLASSVLLVAAAVIVPFSIASHANLLGREWKTAVLWLAGWLVYLCYRYASWLSHALILTTTRCIVTEGLVFRTTLSLLAKRIDGAKLVRTMGGSKLEITTSGAPAVVFGPLPKPAAAESALRALMAEQNP